MAYKNAFFQMLLRSDAVYIKYFPPKGGNELNIDEMMTYIKSHNIEIDLAEFSKAVSEATIPIVFKTNTEKTYPEGEKMLIQTSSDDMYAVCRFIPQSTGGRIMSKEDIIKELNFNKIKFGINEAEIDKYLTNRQYCTDYVFARGIKPVNGHDAKIVYKFNTDLTAKPKEREDGSVDFYSLDIIAHVDKGDELAELIKEDEGKPGKDISGRVILPIKVKKLVLKYGKDITISEDGLHIYSDVSGHAALDREGRVKVSNTLTIKENVDTSTGDIKYDGNVEVGGNVLDGFKIEATGDVIIEGTAEGVTVIAGGQIVLKGGIRGMGKGLLQAGSNVIAKFLENTKVRAKGYVTADAILSSDVSAKGDVVVNSNKGYVNGGTIRSASLIKVKNAGSDMGTNMSLEVGVDPTLMSRFKTLQNDIENIMKTIEESSKSIEIYGKKLKRGERLSPEKMMKFKLLIAEYKRDSESLENMQEEFINIQEEMSTQKGGMIEVANTIHSGVKIVVVDATLYIRDAVQSVRFVRDGADVVMRHMS